MICVSDGFLGVVRAPGSTYSILYVEVIKNTLEVGMKKRRGQRKRYLGL